MKSSQSDKSVITLLIVIAVYSALCLTRHQYVRFTGDSMIYVSLAQKYLAGDFHNAINGYWGPLLAWLLVPLLYAGITDVIAINILNLFFGIFTITGIWLLSRKFEMTLTVRNVILIASFPIIVKCSLGQPMDFLLLGILVHYLWIVFSPSYFESLWSGIFCGLLGSLAYLTKAYAFPFFIVHFLIMNIFYFISNVSSDRRNKIITNVVSGFVMFALFSGIWIMAISDKYGYYTFSTMRKTNFNAPGPDVRGGGLEFGVPVFTEGFFAPPNETAFVIWEDPSYLRGKPWSAWQSKEHFIHFMKLTLKNIAEGLKIFESFSTLSGAIILSCMLLLIVKSREYLFSRDTLLYYTFTLVLFSGGYVLFHFEERYVWLSNILILLMGGHLISMLFRQSFFEAEIRKSLLIVFFLISFTFVPVRFIMQTSKGSIDEEMHALSVDLQRYDIKGNFASNRALEGHEPWHKTFRLAYWLKSRYYGQQGENVNGEVLKTDLEKYDINYYFFWGEAGKVPDFLSCFKDATNGEIQGLRVFSLKDKKTAC